MGWSASRLMLGSPYLGSPGQRRDVSRKRDCAAAVQRLTFLPRSRSASARQAIALYGGFDERLPRAGGPGLHHPREAAPGCPAAIRPVGGRGPSPEAA